MPETTEAGLFGQLIIGLAQAISRMQHENAVRLTANDEIVLDQAHQPAVIVLGLENSPAT